MATTVLCDKLEATKQARRGYLMAEIMTTMKNITRPQSALLSSLRAATQYGI
jgi:hypothetical protein